MRAVLCSEFTGPDHLTVGEIAEPVPAADEILVDVHAASVTYMDRLLVSGGYQMRPPTPFVPGTEAAGIVVSTGAKVSRFKTGDRVACLGWIGGMAERMVAKEWKSVQLPDNVSFEIGSTVIHSYDTAYYALADRAQLKAAETVVVTGAGGGVGMAAVDVAVHLGGRVIAAVGSARHTAALQARSVAAIVDYTRENVRERLAELTGGKGVDVCFDNVGGALFETLARSMAWRGRLLPIGFVGGEVPKLAMNLPLLKNFSVVGVFAGAWEDKEPEAARQAKATIMAWIAAGHLRPHVGMVVPLERAGEAMRAIGDRSATGRIIVKVR